MAESKRRRRRKEWTYKNFGAVLALPDRLAHYLRLWFHISKADWDFMLDKLRQENAREAEWKTKPENKGKVYKASGVAAYREWSKSKGRGKGRRYFAAPCPELKNVQRAILQRFLSQVTAHFIRHGGQVGSSILTNVEHHAGFAQTVFAVDIMNAFPSVYRSRVAAVLGKPFRFGLRQFQGVNFTDEKREKCGGRCEVHQMLDAVVDILVWKDRLPQGPPTSPRVFDIVCGKMDLGLYELVEANSNAFQSYRLTVWSDNVTLSSDGEIPVEVREKLVAVVRNNGFAVHTSDDKMVYYSPETGVVPIVTGLVIGRDGVITMAPNKVNQIRARLHGLDRYMTWDEKLRGEVAGLVGFVRQVYPRGSRKLPSKLREAMETVEARILASRSQVTVTPVEAKPAKRKAKSKPKVSGKTARKGPRKPPSVKETVSPQEAISP